MRRASAIEGDIPTPCLSQAVSLEDNTTTVPQLAEESVSQQTEQPDSDQPETTVRLTDSQNSLVPNPETMC